MGREASPIRTVQNMSANGGGTKLTDTGPSPFPMVNDIPENGKTGKDTVKAFMPSLTAKNTVANGKTISAMARESSPTPTGQPIKENGGMEIF